MNVQEIIYWLGVSNKSWRIESINRRDIEHIRNSIRDMKREISDTKKQMWFYMTEEARRTVVREHLFVIHMYKIALVQIEADKATEKCFFGVK